MVHNVMVIKRDGSKTPYDEEKIYQAIYKAMKYGSGRISKSIAKKVAEMVTLDASDLETISIKDIEKKVFNYLIGFEHSDTARCYEEYRAIQAFKRESNTTDDSILGLIQRTNKDVMEENSNKDAVMASTQRDLIAGEVSKDISRRKKLPARVVQAHDKGILHFHK